jgi:hypothetical protein
MRLMFIIALLCVQNYSIEEAAKSGIGGTVNVPHYGALAGAIVTLKNTSTNGQRQTKTGSDGKYFFECVDDGNYELIFEARGFLTQKQELQYTFQPVAWFIDAVMSLGKIGEQTGSGEDLMISVVDSQTLKAIEGAEVLVDGERFETSNCGKMWRILSRGSYKVEIKKRGYTKKEVVAKVDNKRVAIVVKLEPESPH